TRARKHLSMTHTQMRQIFGKTRWNQPSRFLGEVPAAAVERIATAACAGEQRPRFIDQGYDRGDGQGYVRGGDRQDDARDDHRPVEMRPWRHPQAAPPPTPDAPRDDGRFVDHDFFDDRPHDVTDVPIRRGARVQHERFGRGEVLRVVSVGEPAVVAFFPGWGEKKILARFLKPAG
ncbi:MAG TPA: hypothetical protein VK841_17240, partial [Polyangiaceae bacterium]|nr:hypothetical protein [Polyangiaceae bacterium]